MDSLKIPQSDKKRLRQFLGADSCLDPEDSYKSIFMKQPALLVHTPIPNRKETFILDDLKRQRPKNKYWERSINMPTIPRQPRI